MGPSWVSLLVLAICVGVSYGRSPRIGDFSIDTADKVAAQRESAHQLDSIHNIMKNVAEEEVTFCHRKNPGPPIDSLYLKDCTFQCP